jgi:hypothetical protein
MALKLMMPARVGGPKDAVAQARETASLWQEIEGGADDFCHFPPPPVPRPQTSKLYASPMRSLENTVCEVELSFHNRNLSACLV